MRLLSIDIENFLSIEQAHVDFSDSGLLLLEGWNHDVDRANGAGKSAVLNAISFCLYDKVPRKITASELLRRGTKKGSVSIRLELGGEIYGVQRSRPKGVVFTHEVNGTVETLSLTQEEWEARLRLSYNQFIVAMYCSQANSSGSPRFLLLNDSDKKQFLLQLLNLNEFALCKKRADEKVQQLLILSQQLQSKMGEIQVKIDIYSESLMDENTAYLLISQKKDAKTFYLKTLQDHQVIQRPDLAKYHKIEEDILLKKSEFTKMLTRREMLFAQWERLAQKLRPFDKNMPCPTCGTVIDNPHAEIMHKAEIEKIKDERSLLKQQIDVLDTTLLNEYKVDELYSKLKERKRKESVEFERASIAQVELTSNINSIDIEIGNLNKKLIDNAQLVGRIDKFKAQRDSFKVQLEDLAKELEIQKTVASIYSPTGAQAYVLDSAVFLFNEQISKYIDMLWPNLTYELQSYKENVKGDIIAKFTEVIIMDGKNISLGSLSGGELKALSICADMALLGILEQQFGLHLSPIIFDEAFDGLDAPGKEFALELIRGLSQDRLVMVIDHASEMQASFDNILRIEKRNGVSALSIKT